MTTWYRVRKWSTETDVTPVEVLDETAGTLILDGGINHAGKRIQYHVAKRSAGDEYHRTRGLALIVLRGYTLRRMTALRERLVELDRQYEAISAVIHAEAGDQGDASDDPSVVAAGPFPPME